MADCDSLNAWSAVQDFIAYPGAAPGWADLSQGHAYALSVYNTTDTDIIDGVIGFEGACASPDNPCIPADEWVPIQPVAGCAPIVSGVPEVGPVTVTLSAERPIRAYGECKYAVPCPLPFMRVTGIPAGCFATIVVTRLRRTDWAHVGPYGYIPPPLQLGMPMGAMAALPSPASAARQAPQPQHQPQPARQRRNEAA